MTKRKAFNFYYSHWEQIKLLNNKQQLDLFKAICQVQFLEINILDIKFKDNTLNLVWTGMIYSLETSLKGYINRMESLNNEVLIPPCQRAPQPPKQPPCQQEEEEEEVKEEEEVQLTTLKYSEIKKETWDKWIRYKKSQFKFEYKTLETEQIALTNLISISRNNNTNADKIINQSIENGWKGLFPLKKEVKQNDDIYIPPDDLIPND